LSKNCQRGVPKPRDFNGSVGAVGGRALKGPIFFGLAFDKRARRFQCGARPFLVTTGTTGRKIMNRRGILCISAMTALGLALLPGSIVAQQGTLKQQLVGTWTLVSCDFKQPFCVNPSGSLSLDASGRYTQVLAARGRPKATIITPRADIKPEEYKAMAQGVVAQFGTWSVNEADKTLTTHVEGALFPNAEGTDARVSVSLTGDELKTAGASGATVVWTRAK
jgi:Lipocalin-like domain